MHALFGLELMVHTVVRTNGLALLSGSDENLLRVLNIETAIKGERASPVAFARDVHTILADFFLLRSCCTTQASQGNLIAARRRRQTQRPCNRVAISLNIKQSMHKATSKSTGTARSGGGSSGLGGLLVNTRLSLKLPVGALVRLFGLGPTSGCDMSLMRGMDRETALTGVRAARIDFAQGICTILEKQALLQTVYTVPQEVRIPARRRGQTKRLFTQAFDELKTMPSLHKKAFKKCHLKGDEHR